MTTLEATGHFTHVHQSPTLTVSAGAGNTEDADEIHLMLRDNVDGRSVVAIGWFKVDELRKAIDAHAPRKPKILSEPAA